MIDAAAEQVYFFRQRQLQHDVFALAKFIQLVVQRFAYPEAKAETEIVAHEGELDDGTPKRLVEFANRVRGMEELQLAETVSTRLLVTAAKLIASGVAPRLACNAAVVQPITDDHAQLEALQDLANLMF